jgi:hypothetical protein
MIFWKIAQNVAEPIFPKNSYLTFAVENSGQNLGFLCEYFQINCPK